MASTHVGGFDARGSVQVVPDFVVEVLSPEDQETATRRKIAWYLEAGVEVVWVIDPVAHTCEIHGHDGHDRTVSAEEPLVCRFIPGWTATLAEIALDPNTDSDAGDA